MTIGKHRRTDPITPAAVIAVGVGVALWLWPPPHLITQVGSALPPPAVSVAPPANSAAAAPLATTNVHQPAKEPVATTQAQPADPAGSTDLSGALPANIAAHATAHPKAPRTDAPAPATGALQSQANTSARSTFQGYLPNAVPASISLPFASTHHPDGVQMTVLPHGPTSHGDRWIPGPEEGINNWANDVSWLNTPGFAAPFSSHGAIIIAGHINWDGTPGALSDLTEYATADIGKDITITMTDGRTRIYRITTGFAVAKDQLATETNQGPLHTAIFGQTQTYGPPGHPSEELRLISCGGQYDAATRNYTSNIILTAEPVS